MEFVWLGLLAAVYVIGLPVAVIVLMVKHGHLKSRVDGLERGAGQKNTPSAMPAEAQAPWVATAEPETTVPSDAPEAQAVPPPVPPAGQKPRPPVWAPRKESEVAADEGAERVEDMPPAPPAPPPGPSLTGRFFTWLTANWFYAVSAVSLALAGLFMVQYGIENGLIPPTVRVLAAVVFGGLLIGAGEYIRGRFGDTDDTSTVHLPQVFSGAGIVTLFGGVLSARLLYGLIGPEVALVGMVAVALLALALGWLHGPLLAAVGVVGAFVSPMIVGGASTDPSWVYIYFAVVAALGLGIDTLRRWAWVSGLSVGLGFVMGWLLYLSAPQTTGVLCLYVVALAMMAVLIPSRALAPDHQGPQINDALRGNNNPIFPTVLAAVGLGAASITLAVLSSGLVTDFWLAVVLLSVLGLAWILWSDAAPALQDQAILPLGGLFVAILLQWSDWGPVGVPFFTESSEPAAPRALWAVTYLVVLGAVWSLAAAWRSWRGGDMRMVWAAAAALIAPGIAILLEVTWRPALAVGPYPWALHAAALAAGMVFLAERFARKDGPDDRLRMAFFTLSALSAIAFSLVIVLSSAALTVALAVVVVAAAVLDRKFDLRPITYFIGLGVLVLGYRLLADPGLDWAVDAPLLEMVLAYGGTFAAMVGALSVSRRRARLDQMAILDSASWSTGAFFVSLLMYRGIEELSGAAGPGSHWALGLFASVWFAAALAQLNLTTGAGRLQVLRYVMAGLFGLAGLAALFGAVLVESPLQLFTFNASKVRGPMLFNTLIPAYLFPALVLWIGATRFPSLPPLMRRILNIGSISLAGLWLFTAIRHLWQGAGGMPLSRGFDQGEVSTYTVAVLMIGAGLFYQSLAKGDTVLRRAGLVVIGVAVAKVFLIDIASLGGLVRVFSFLLLGLALAGLAWLNNWAQRNAKPRD